MFSGFGVNPPASGFQSYSYSSLKTSPSVTLKVVPSVLASSVCWCLQCLISTLIQGGGSGHFCRLTCSVVLWRGRNAVNKYHWRVLAVSRPPWVCPRLQHVCFPCLHCLDSRLLCWELSEAGPGLCALPRSKLLRFRYLGTHRCRLGWACVLCPSQVQAALVTDQVFDEHGRSDLSPPLSLPLSFLGVQPAHLLRQMSTIQNPKKSSLAMKSACSLVDDASLWLRLPLSHSGFPRLPVSGGGWAAG